MFDEDDLIMISALQHYVFCPRQCALIHIEQVWTESGLTAEGRIMHEKVHEEQRKSRGSVRVEHGIPLRSLRLGLIGNGRCGGVSQGRQSPLAALPRGVQAGQAASRTIAMLCSSAPRPCALKRCFSWLSRGERSFTAKRGGGADVVFDETLRRETEETVEKARDLIMSGITPPPVYAKRCESCSLIGNCMPKKIEKGLSVKRYLARITESLGKP